MEPLLNLIPCGTNPVNVQIIIDNLFIKPNIKELRKARGYSQKELARVLGIAQSTLSSWESGTNVMDINTIIKLAFLLRVSFEEIMNIPVTTFINRKAPLGFDKEFLNQQDHIIEALAQATSPTPYTVKHVSNFNAETLEPYFDGETELDTCPTPDTYTFSCPAGCCFTKPDSLSAEAVVLGNLEPEEYQDGDYVVAAASGEAVTICRIYFQSVNNDSFILTYPEQSTPPKLFTAHNIDQVKLLGKVLRVELKME